MFYAASRAMRVAIGVSAIVAVAFAPGIQAQKGTPSAAPNYELASAWTTQKVSKLVFDTSVTPRWLETSDRFWYSYQTRDGRRFFIVDPVKKAKAPLFDHARMASALTMITRIPYDAQHLPFGTGRCVERLGLLVESEGPDVLDAFDLPAELLGGCVFALTFRQPVELAVREGAGDDVPVPREGERGDAHLAGRSGDLDLATVDPNDLSFVARADEDRPVGQEDAAPRRLRVVHRGLAERETGSNTPLGIDRDVRQISARQIIDRR